MLRYKDKGLGINNNNNNTNNSNNIIENSIIIIVIKKIKTLTVILSHCKI